MSCNLTYKYSTSAQFLANLLQWLITCFFKLPPDTRFAFINPDFVQPFEETFHSCYENGNVRMKRRGYPHQCCLQLHTITEDRITRTKLLQGWYTTNLKTYENVHCTIQNEAWYCCIPYCILITNQACCIFNYSDYNTVHWYEYIICTASIHSDFWSDTTVYAKQWWRSDRLVSNAIFSNHPSNVCD